MRLLGKVRFSMASTMMLVATAAAASALFAKAYRLVPPVGQAYLKVDVPALFVLSIILTAVTLAALKAHSAVQTMLQVALACLGYLSLIGLTEWGQPRPLLYWFQAGFGLLVTAPMLARRLVKTEMERGPRRTWWKKTFEAVIFSFLTMLLILAGALAPAAMAVLGLIK